MENYAFNNAATLSLRDVETTDNLISSALETLPKSAVAQILPVVKTKGPTSQWVEPFYNLRANPAVNLGEDLDGSLKLVSRSVEIFNNRKRLGLTSETVEDIMKMYTPEGFKTLIRNWFMFHKNAQQRADLISILKSPEVDGVPPEATVPNMKNVLTDDNSKIIQTRILQAISDLQKDFQLQNVAFSIVAPYEFAFAILSLQNQFRGMINVMYDDSIEKLYIFPTGDNNLSRAGLAIFEFADNIQRSYDSETGEEVYFGFNRSKVVLNPIHQLHPIVRNIVIA